MSAQIYDYHFVYAKPYNDIDLESKIATVKK